MLFEGWREIFEEAIGPINFVDTCFVVPGKRGVVFCSVNRKERGEKLVKSFFEGRESVGSRVVFSNNSQDLDLMLKHRSNRS